MFFKCSLLIIDAIIANYLYVIRNFINVFISVFVKICMYKIASVLELKIWLLNFSLQSKVSVQYPEVVQRVWRHSIVPTNYFKIIGFLLETEFTPLKLASKCGFSNFCHVAIHLSGQYRCSLILPFFDSMVFSFTVMSCDTKNYLLISTWECTQVWFSPVTIHFMTVWFHKVFK